MWVKLNNIIYDESCDWQGMFQPDLNTSLSPNSLAALTEGYVYVDGEFDGEAIPDEVCYVTQEH